MHDRGGGDLCGGPDLLRHNGGEPVTLLLEADRQVDYIVLAPRSGIAALRYSPQVLQGTSKEEWCGVHPLYIQVFFSYISSFSIFLVLVSYDFTTKNRYPYDWQ